VGFPAYNVGDEVRIRADELMIDSTSQELSVAAKKGTDNLHSWNTRADQVGEKCETLFELGPKEQTKKHDMGGHVAKLLPE